MGLGSRIGVLDWGLRLGLHKVPYTYLDPFVDKPPARDIQRCLTTTVNRPNEALTTAAERG